MTGTLWGMAKENIKKKSKICDSWQSHCILSSPAIPQWQKEEGASGHLFVRCSTKLSKKAWQPRGRFCLIEGLVWKSRKGRRVRVWSCERNVIWMLSSKYLDYCYTAEANQQVNDDHHPERLFGLSFNVCLLARHLISLHLSFYLFDIVVLKSIVVCEKIIQVSGT